MPTNRAMVKMASETERRIDALDFWMWPFSLQ